MPDDLPQLQSFQSGGLRPEDMPVSGSSFDAPVARRPEELTGVGMSGIPETAGSAPWSDVGHGFMASLHEAGAGLAGAMATSGAATPEALPELRQTIAEQREKADVERQQMSPGVEGGLRHPWVWAGEQIPGLAEMAGAGVAGGMVGGPVGAALGVGAATGVTTEGQVAQELISQGITPSKGAMAGAFGAGFVGGALTEGMGGLVGKIVTPKIAQVGLGVVGGTITFTGQEAATASIEQSEQIRAGKREGYDPGEILERAEGAAGAGAILSAGGALLHGRGEKAPPPRVETSTEDLGKTQIDKSKEAQEKAGGQATQVRSDRVAKKPEAQAGATPGVTDKVSGPPTPPDPAGDPAVAMAAKGQGATPSAEAGTPPGQAATAPAPTKGEALKKQPPPAPKPPGTPPTPDMVRQREEVMDKNHPRDVMLYPPGTEVPPIPKDKTHSFGKFDLGDDYGTLVYDRNLQGGSRISGPELLRQREAGTEYDYIRDALQKAHDRSAAHEAAKAAPPPEAPPEAPAAPPEPVRTPPATPVAAEARPPSEAAPEAPRAEPAPVAEPVAPQPVLDKSRGVAALLNDLKTTGRPPSPEEAAWLNELGLKPQGTVSEAAVTPATSEMERVRAEAAAAQAQAAGVRVPAGAAEAVTPRVTEPAAEPRRVTKAPRLLEDLTAPKPEMTKGEKLKAKNAAKKEARLAAKKEAAQKELETGVPQKAGGRGWTKEEREAKAANNDKAREVVMRHLPKGDETPQEQHARAKAMMEDAEKSGVTIPKQFRADHLNSDDVILLAEARARAAKGPGEQVAFARFKDREAAYFKKASGESIGDIRRASSAERGAKGSGAIKGEEAGAISEVGPAVGEHALSPEEELIRKQEGGEEEEAPAKELTTKEVEPEGGEVKKPAPEYKPEVAGAAVRAATVVTRRGKYGGFRPSTPIVSLKREALKARRDVEPAAEPEAGGRSLTTVDEHGNLIDVAPRSSTTVKEIFSKYFDLRNYSPELRGMIHRLAEKVKEIAGDVPVHFLSHEDMSRVFEGGALGAYDSHGDHILLNNDLPLRETVLHEAFHAAIGRMLNHDPELMRHVDRLRDEVLASKEAQGLSAEMRELLKDDSEEFLTRLMTESKIQAILKKTKISRELAEEMGIPKWRKATMWEASLATIRKILGMGPRDTSAIEAAMAVSEFAMHKAHPGEGMKFAARYAKADIGERMAPRAQRMLDPEAKQEDEANAGKRYADAAMQASQNAFQNGSASVQRALPKGMAGPMMEHWYGKMFTDDKGNIVKDIRTLMGRMNTDLERMREKDSKLYEDAMINAKKFPGQMEDYAKLKDLINGTKIDPTKPLTLKGKRAEFQRDINDWRTNTNWPEANKIYERLRPELQKQLTDEITFGHEKAKQISEGFLHSVMDHFNLPAGVTDKAEMLDRIMKGEMTDDEREHYTSMHAMGEIAEAQRLMRGDRNFFPAFREGKYVVNGLRDMPETTKGSDTGMDGNKLPDNTREFTDREEAHKYFSGDHKMHPDIEIVQYAKDTKARLDTALEREMAADDARGGPGNIEKRFQVKLQREHMELHDSAAEAGRARESMIADGMKEENVSGVLNRREDKNWGRINPEFARNVKRNIDHSDLPPEGKEAAAEAVRNFMLVRQSAIQSHLVHRRYVGGADYSNAEGIRSYAEAANRHLVTSKYGAERDALMERMEDQEKRNQSDPKISLHSSAVANELRARVYRSPEDLAKKLPWIVRQAQTLAYFHYMAGPRHMAMMQTHPIVYSAPEMAGRHGPGIYKLMHDTFRDSGGPLQGAKGSLQATWNFAKLMKAFVTRDHEAVAALAKMPNTLKSMFATITDKEELEDMQELADIGVIPPGYTNDFHASTGKNKLEIFMNQFNHAYDVQNRFGVARTAYRAEMKLTGDRQMAKDYARKIVENTIGSNTPMDIGTAMKNPMARMFMQFKHFPMRQTELLLRNVYSAFRDESPEVRREAGKAAMYQIATSFAGAGVNGLPKSLLKPLVLFGYVMGVTPSPTQIDDRVRRFLGDIFGATGANMFMDGALAAFPHAPNLTNMFSRDMDFAFGEPQQTKTGVDMMSWLGQTVFGAPGSMVVDALKGGRAMLNGEEQKAMTYLPGPRLMSDIARSWYLPDQGLVTLGGKQLTAPSDIDMLTRILGFQTQEAEQAYEGRTMAQEEIQAQQAAKAAAPKTKAEELKAKAKAAREQDILGIPVTKSNRAILEKYQGIYQ